MGAFEGAVQSNSSVQDSPLPRPEVYTRLVRKGQVELSHIPNVEEATKYLLSNNNDAPSITKYGVFVRLKAQIVALAAHCAKGAPLGSSRTCLTTAFTT